MNRFEVKGADFVSKRYETRETISWFLWFPTRHKVESEHNHKKWEHEPCASSIPTKCMKILQIRIWVLSNHIKVGTLDDTIDLNDEPASIYSTANKQFPILSG